MPAKYALNTIGANKCPFFTVFIHGGLTIAPCIALNFLVRERTGIPLKRHFL
jgi:hypothetical protein